ncbi:MAG: ankyrin repeat domain-containing protein, partial [Gammaproteobacteria bacterium]
ALAECDLCTLAKNNDWAAAETLLDNSPPVNSGSDAVAVDVNGKDKNGRTALFIAVRRDYAEFAMNLMAHGAYAVDVTIPNRHGRTPLMWAAQNGDFALVLDLLKNGANIHAQRDGNDRTALDFALDNGNSEVAEHLVA